MLRNFASALCMAVLMSLTANCSTMTATVETNNGIATAAFRPISWSTKDTRQTVAEIKIHNAVGEKLGFWTAPPGKAVRGWARVKAKVKHWPNKKATAVAPAPVPQPAPPMASAPVPATLEPPAAQIAPAATPKPSLMQRIRAKLHRKPKP